MIQIIATAVVLSIINSLTTYIVLKNFSTLLVLAVCILLSIAIFGISIILVKEKNKREKAEEVAKQSERQRAKNQRDLDMARQIQQSLLGRHSIKAKELKVLASCNPAEKIGGDFYSFSQNDFHRTISNDKKGIIELKNKTDRTISLCIGDVAGHGVASALVMLLTKSLMEELMNRHASPAKIMEIANTRLMAHTEQSDVSFVTATILQVNLDTLSMQYSKAGHTDSILIKKDGETSMLSTEGVFLGMFEEGHFEEKTTQLEKGDKIIMYTDGILDCRNPEGELFGMKRFMDFIASMYEEPIETILEAINNKMTSWAEGRQKPMTQTLVLVEVV